MKPTYFVCQHDTEPWTQSAFIVVDSARKNSNEGAILFTKEGDERNTGYWTYVECAASKYREVGLLEALSYTDSEEAAVKVMRVLRQINNTSAELIFPEPAQYKITYKTQSGEVKSYTISNPIQDDGRKITAYAFKHGVRSFIKDRITKFQKITCS